MSNRKLGREVKLSPELRRRVVDMAAGNEPGATASLALLYQFSEQLKEDLVHCAPEEVEGMRGAVKQIRRFLDYVHPVPQAEEPKRNSYIPEP